MASPRVKGKKPVQRKSRARRKTTMKLGNENPDYEKMLALHVRGLGLPVPFTQHRFHPTRLWRFDLAWPDHGLAVEVDGGVFTKGGHTRGVGYTKDCEKLANAVIRGWRVMKVTTGQVKSGQAALWIEEFFKQNQTPKMETK